MLLKKQLEFSQNERWIHWISSCSKLQRCLFHASPLRKWFVAGDQQALDVRKRPRLRNLWNHSGKVILINPRMTWWVIKGWKPSMPLPSMTIGKWFKNAISISPIWMNSKKRWSTEKIRCSVKLNKIWSLCLNVPRKNRPIFSPLCWTIKKHYNKKMKKNREKCTKPSWKKSTKAKKARLKKPKIPKKLSRDSADPSLRFLKPSYLRNRWTLRSKNAKASSICVSNFTVNIIMK